MNIQSSDIQRKNILFLTPRFPYPLIGGDRIKSFYVLRYLAERYNVKLITYSHGAYPSEERLKPLRDMGIDVKVVVLNPIIHGLFSIRSLWTSLPLEIAFYHDKKFQSEVDKAILSEHFDCAIAFFMRTAESIRSFPIKKILIAEDWRVLYQSRSAKASTNLLQKLIRYWEVFKLKSYEPSVINDFDITTLVTERDIEEMKKHNPDAHFELLTNGIDLQAMPASTQEQLQSRSGLLFAGVLQLWANEMMATTIVNEIMPIVHKAFPKEELSIVGSNPSSSITSLSSTIIHVHADVPSIEEYFYKAKIFIHPHKGASGIQNKVLQALAMGCAVVTTSTGIQGIPAEHGKHVLIGNSPQEMAQHVMYLLQNDEERIKQAQHGRALIEQHFSWNATLMHLADMIEGLNNSKGSS